MRKALLFVILTAFFWACEESAPLTPPIELDQANDVDESSEDQSTEIDLGKPDLEPDLVEPDQVEPDLVEPDQVEPDLVEPDQIEPDQIEPDQVEPDQIEDTELVDGTDPCEGLGIECCSELCPCAANGMECVLSASQCKALALDGRCWQNEDCSDGLICVGASVCPCGALCVREDELGVCMPASGGCCDNASSIACPAEELCLTMAPEPDTCHALLSPPQCWQDEDCPSKQCVGALLCSCNMDCMSTPGACAEDCSSLEGSCCSTQCPCTGTNERCVYPSSDALGLCKPTSSTTVGCWEDADCGANRRCDGASICPCGALCLLPDAPGVCLSASSDCCDATSSSNTCGTNRFCMDLPTDDTCLQTPPNNRCWADADCPGNRVCRGAVICSCTQTCVSQLGFCN